MAQAPSQHPACSANTGRLVAKLGEPQQNRQRRLEPHKVPLGDSKRIQESPKRFQELPKRIQDTLKNFPRVSQETPKITSFSNAEFFSQFLGSFVELVFCFSFLLFQSPSYFSKPCSIFFVQLLEPSCKPLGSLLNLLWKILGAYEKLLKTLEASQEGSWSVREDSRASQESSRASQESRRHPQEFPNNVKRFSRGPRDAYRNFSETS